jgi:arylformamidase
MTIHDISLTVTPRIVTWDGVEPGCSLDWSARIGPDCDANVSLITVGAHTGTHVDAPLHFIYDGGTLENLCLETLIGPALVVEIFGRPMIEAANLEAVGIPPGTERLILKTDNTRRGLVHSGTFHKDYVSVAPSGASWLVEHGVKLIGIDYLSIGPYGPLNTRTHRTLLGASVVILETLVLDSIAPGAYTLIALPPKLAGAEAAPCRVVLVEES